MRFAQIGFEQLRWVAWEKESARLAYVQASLDENWDALRRAFSGSRQEPASSR
jgi:hypothetical protein